MDLSATSALNLYTYQTTAKTSGQASAIAQLMSTAASSTSDLSGGTGDLSGLAGSSGTLANLRVGAYEASRANGYDTSGLRATSLGITAATATGLLADSNLSAGLQGFDASSLNPALTATLAGAQAQAALAAVPTYTTAQQAIAGATSSSFNQAMNLLA